MVLTMQENKRIINVKEIAEFFQKNPSWVYKNWKRLGGRKLGGSLVFPSLEDLYERLFFKKEEKVAVRVHRVGCSVHGNVVQNKNGGEKCRIRKKGGDQESEACCDDPNRHGLLNNC